MKRSVKFLPIFLLGVQALALILILLYLLSSNHVRAVTGLSQGNIRYVLVNEDLGAEFNGMEYNLGLAFVTLISQDMEYRWQTASRSVAEAGFRNGTFDVMVILPQNFSQRLLDLQSFTPEQAQIIYEVRQGYNDLANMAVRLQVSDILNDFNQRIVRMYFSSLLGNLFDAQLNVGEMINDEQDRHDLFLDFVREPFYGLPDFFEAVVDGTIRIEAETDFWQTQHDEFSETTGQILTSAAEGLVEQLFTLEDYIDLMQLLGEMNQRNAQFSVNQQAELDEAFYRDQFSDFGNVMLSWMSLFHGEEFTQGILGDFNHMATTFQDQQSDLIKALRVEIASLERQIDDLFAARRMVSGIYFADENLSSSDVTDADFHQAIINLSNIIEHEPNLADAYFETLRLGIGQIASAHLREMINHLHEINQIEYSDKSWYLAQLDLINRFAEEELSTTVEENSNFAFINVYHYGYQTYPHRATFEIFPNPEITATQVIRVHSDSNIRVYDGDTGLTTITDVKTEIQSQINSHLLAAGYVDVRADVSYVDYDADTNQYQYLRIDFEYIGSPISGEIEGGADEAVEDGKIANLVQTECEVCEECDPSPPVSFTITVDMYLIWEFSETEIEAQSYQQNFKWMNCTDGTTCPEGNEEYVVFASELAYFSTLAGAHLDLMSDLGKLFEQFHLLSSMSRQIVTLFGAPTSEGQYLGLFLDSLEQPRYDDDGMRVNTIRLQADPSSVYHRYANLSIGDQRELIIESIYDGFRADGIRIYKSLSDRHNQLIVTTIANRLILEAIVHPDSFLDEANAMLAWYLDAIAGVTDSYQNWSESEILEIVLSNHFGSFELDANSTTIYFDDRYGGNMLATIGLLSSLMEGDSESILSYALEMIALDDQFAMMVGQTEDAQGLAAAILADMDLLSELTDASVLENLKFSEHFSQVMANARIGGADNHNVLDFLSSPISLVGVYEVLGEVSFMPYYLTIISAMLSLAVGYGMRYFWTKRKRTIAEKMVNRGLIWKNAPFVLKLSLVSLSVGLIFSAISVRSIEYVSIITWMLSVPIFIVIGILAVSYLARQFPKASLFIIGIIIAAYLLLNPVLGIQVESGTFISMLFNLSPLQQVEHLFAWIIAGETLSILRHLGLTVLAAVAVVLNLFVHMPSSTDKGAGGELINETI